MSQVKLFSHYQILGIERDASADEVRTAYRRMARLYHPDRTKDGRDSQETMARINTAYDVLFDPERRAEYDRILDAEYAESANERTRAGQAAQRLLGIPNWAWYLLLITMTLTVFAVGWLSLHSLAARTPASKMPAALAQSATPHKAADGLPLMASRSLQSMRATQSSTAQVNTAPEPALHLVQDNTIRTLPLQIPDSGKSAD